MGRKRKHGAALLAGRKRLRPEHASGDWASLPTDMVCLVTDRLLHIGDVVDYVVFRAVCSAWRASTPAPRERDPALMDPSLRQRDWIALCDGDSDRPDDAGDLDLFHTRTARRVRVRVPDLADHRIVGFSEGLLVLMHRSNAGIRVLNPLTRVAVDFPSLASVYPEAIKYPCAFLGMRAAVCTAASSIAVVVWCPYMDPVLAAEADSDHWEILHRELPVSNTLVFQGRLYATTTFSSLDVVQLYPPTPKRTSLDDLPVTVARAPKIDGRPVGYNILLVESRGQMLLVTRHYFAATSANIGAYSPDKWWQQIRFAVYEVNLNSNGNDAKLTPVSCLLDRALFLSSYGCLSVSAIDLPSLRANSIYFSEGYHPVLMHSLTTGLSEELALECQIHDTYKRIRPSVRPFTIIDHLLTFCHPKEWTKGLMFHEYHYIPESFRELRNKIRSRNLALFTDSFHSKQFISLV
jgi:hypothetical protein